MSDHGEQGAVPAEERVAADLPSLDEVLQREEETSPVRTQTAMRRRSCTPEERAAIEAGGVPVDDPDEILIEGPNSA